MPLFCLESIPGLLSRVCSIYALKWVCQIAFLFSLLYLMDSCSLAFEHEYLPYSASVLEFFCGILILRIVVISKHQTLGFIHFQ